MIPAPNLSHEVEARNLLTSMFRNRRVVVGLLSAHVRRLQAIELAMWTSILGRTLSGVGWTLDTIGKIIGEPRGDRHDARYRVGLALRVLVNRSDSLLPSLLHIVDVASEGEPWSYFPAYPAAFRIIFSGDLDHLLELQRAIREVRPVGVRASIVWQGGATSLLIPSYLAHGDIPQANGPVWNDPTDTSAEAAYALETT